MGNSHKTIVEINGKKYDTRTGKPIDQATPRNIATAPGRIIDGVARPIRKSSDVHSTTSKSKTLMRHAVKKPVMQPKTVSNSVNNLSAGKKNTDINKPTTFYQSDKQRLERAQTIKQNKLVSRFSDFASPKQASPVKPVHAKMSVKPAPAHAQPSNHQPAKQHSIIEQGLKSAQGHNQVYNPKTKATRKKSRIVSLAAASFAVFMLAGFFGYQNAPNISMRYAAARSGVSANIPKASGFSLNNKIHYTPGQITMTFKSNSDERQFNVVQRESAWNSDSLKSNYVATVDSNAQTYEDKGRTIYLYGDSNATWVSGGVWYDINGNSQLTSDQLIRIASSM